MDFTFSLDDSSAEALRRAAEREKRSWDEVVRAALRSYLTRHDRIVEIAETIAMEDRALLDRLGGADAG